VKFYLKIVGRAEEPLFWSAATGVLHLRQLEAVLKTDSVITGKAPSLASSPHTWDKNGFEKYELDLLDYLIFFSES